MRLLMGLKRVVVVVVVWYRYGCYGVTVLVGVGLCRELLLLMLFVEYLCDENQ